MKSSYLITGCILLFACAVMPAQAFSAQSLAITLDANGNAQAHFTYGLSFTEQIAVFANITNPVSELKTVFDDNLNREVTVVNADSSSADITIPSFATISQANGTETMTTPAFSLSTFQNEIRQNWWAPLVSVDMTPEVTTITFPDGYQTIYYNQISIPAVTRRIE
jgi:hypothetical protein